MKNQTDVHLPFVNRAAAGKKLASALAEYQGHRNAIILALPRGGLPVGDEVAYHLGLPLDVMLVRKLGLPGYGELAMGAIAGDGVQVLNEEVIARYRISAEVIEQVAQQEQRELERRNRTYRGDRPWPSLTGRIVILVDDGVATGATMLAAVQAARTRGASKVVVATPVIAPDILPRLEAEADEVHALASTSPFYAVGAFYRDFAQIEDEEVIEILQRAWQSSRAAPPGTQTGHAGSDRKH